MSKKKSISAHQARVGEMYLTRQRIPVRIKKIASRGVEVILTLLKKPVTLKRSTPLFTYDKSKVKGTTILRRLSRKKKVLVKATSTTTSTPIISSSPPLLSKLPTPPSATQAQRGPKGPRSMSVTSIVDPMLFEGIHTRQQINTALAESEIGKTLSNRDMGWYTAYRISVLKEKGHIFEKFENGTIKISKIIPNLSFVEIK